MFGVFLMVLKSFSIFVRSEVRDFFQLNKQESDSEGDGDESTEPESNDAQDSHTVNLGPSERLQ